jgi:hypothetical protein
MISCTLYSCVSKPRPAIGDDQQAEKRTKVHRKDMVDIDNLAVADVPLGAWSPSG